MTSANTDQAHEPRPVNYIIVRNPPPTYPSIARNPPVLAIPTIVWIPVVALTYPTA
jgi:hypothetical protein